ncbi:MAG: hypothetical protein MJE77_22275 [Proteobacteria bacterium]|nr:hypothetical protein [Pseudomonadota bacterium]
MRCSRTDVDDRTQRMDRDDPNFVCIVEALTDAGVAGQAKPSVSTTLSAACVPLSAPSATTTRLDSQIDGVPCIGLNNVRMPGNLVAVEVPERGRAWTVLGEWPERRS